MLSRPAPGPTGPLPEKTQVVIVGAGPAGLTAANLLGKLGVDALLVEQNGQTADQPKAIALDDEYLRLLEHLGLGPAMREHRSEPFGIWFMGVGGDPIIQVSGSTTPNGFGRRCAVMQPVFEKVLLAQACRFDCVQVHYGRKVQGLIQTPGGVEVNIDGKVVRADFVLGCDGPRSFIRDSLGIDFVGSRIDQPHLVVDLADFPDASPHSRFFCDPRRPFNSIPSVYGGRRIEFMLNKDDRTEHILSDEGIRSLVDQYTPYRGCELHVIRRAIYGFSERIASRLQEGRVFLLGDAAHVMPPFGGQGMNTAARDVNNLCWKISMVLKGQSSPALLASYDGERRSQIENIVKYSVLVGRFANIRSRPLAVARDMAFKATRLVPPVNRFFSEMRYMPRPTIFRGVVSSTDRRYRQFVGRPLPRLSLVQGRDVTTIDDIAGEGFCLIGFDVRPADLRATAQDPLWRDLPVKLVAITTGEAFSVPDVTFVRMAAAAAAELDRLRGAIAVLRPDRYVAAMARPDRMGKAFQHLAAYLAPPPGQLQPARAPTAA